MRFFVFAIALVVWATSAFAERRVALVFGSDRYDTLRPLQNAVNDARAIEEALEALDFEVFSEKNRDLRRMRRALSDFEEDAEGADVAFVFFAGHGVEISGDNRLLPTDADASSPEALEASSLSLNEVHDVVTRVAKSALIVLDACRDDPFGAFSGAAGRGAVSLFETGTVNPGFGRMGSADQTLFAFAAAPGETASDGEGGNSPFTTALTKYLRTDGLEIRSVLTLVQQEVYDRTRGQQLPYVESGLPQLFFASSAADDLPERERLLLAMADIDNDVRQDVERVASDAGVPLAPLYSALISSDLRATNRQQRRAKLQEAAEAFTKVRAELTNLRSGDARVTELRQQAEEQLSLGAFEGARDLLTEAARTDALSRETLKANLVERTLSEAATHYLNGGAALAELRYALAVADYEKALGLFEEVEPDLLSQQAWEQQIDALDALGHINITIGNLPEASAAFERQRSAALAASGIHINTPDLLLSLAQAQDNLGDVLFEQGQIAAALVHYRESHNVRARLVDAHPDNNAYLSAYSVSHSRLGRIYFRQGSLETSEGYYLTKYRLAEERAASETDDYWWRRDLSVSNEKLGDIQRARGDLEGAMGHYMASLERMLPIREANPDDPELSRFISIAIDRAARVFLDQENLDEALSRFEQSRDLRLAMVETDPANTDWQHLLGLSHEQIGDVLMSLGDVAGATVAYETKHRIVSQLSASDPTNVRWLRDLSVADERLGGLAHNRGDHKAATGYYQSSLDRMTPIKDASPTDMELNRFLSHTESHMGNVLMDMGESDKAISHYQAGLEHRKKLVAHDPQNADWRFLLGVSYELIGNAYMRVDQPVKAVEAYQTELEVMSKLLDQDPDSLRWARAVSFVNEHLGRAHLAAGNVDRALTEFTASLDRMTAASRANPDSLWVLRFTGVTSRTIGEAHLSYDQFDEAAEAFARSLEIALRLTTESPGNGWWQRDLFVAYNGLIAAGATPKVDREVVQTAATIMQELGTTIPSDAALLEAFERSAPASD